MRISFNQKYDQSLSAILRTQDKLLTASAQLEKQTKILTPADDPSGSARVVALDQQITQTDQYQANSIGLKNSLNIEETVLSGIRKSMDQARLLTVSLGNGAYSQLDRSAVAKQLENIRAEVFDLMNMEVADEMIHLLSHEYIHYLPQFNYLYEGAWEILDYLFPKYKLHIITNGFQTVQAGKLKNSNIEHFFQNITNS